LLDYCKLEETVVERADCTRTIETKRMVWKRHNKIKTERSALDQDGQESTGQGFIGADRTGHNGQDLI
jgi:hypothetical protein